MKIVEMIVDETNEEGGVFAISLVNQPAIESDFVALSKEHEIKFEKVSEEKRLLVGPALIPNKTVFRKGEGEDVEDYYIYFSKDTIRQASQLFLKRGKQGESTLEHAMKADGVTVVESWIVEDTEKDKSALYEMSMPEGTWMTVVKVDNDEVWQDVKDGDYKGFSIEGYFVDKTERTAQEEEVTEYDRVKAIRELIEKSGL